MRKSGDGVGDRRWVILLENGQFNNISRAFDPTEEEIERFMRHMADSGVRGWLAVMSGSIYAEQKPSFLMVRPLLEPAVPFDDAVAECLRNAE